MTPKELFLKGTSAKVVAPLLEGLAFQEATQTALLEYQDRLCTNSNEVNAAAANHFRLEGARQAISILKNIAKPDEAPKRQPIGQLTKL